MVLRGDMCNGACAARSAQSAAQIAWSSVQRTRSSVQRARASVQRAHASAEPASFRLWIGSSSKLDSSCEDHDSWSLLQRVSFEKTSTSGLRSRDRGPRRSEGAPMSRRGTSRSAVWTSNDSN